MPDDSNKLIHESKLGEISPGQVVKLICTPAGASVDWNELTIDNRHQPEEPGHLTAPALFMGAEFPRMSLIGNSVNKAPLPNSISRH